MQIQSLTTLPQGKRNSAVTTAVKRAPTDGCEVWLAHGSDLPRCVGSGAYPHESSVWSPSMATDGTALTIRVRARCSGCTKPPRGKVARARRDSIPNPQRGGDLKISLSPNPQS